MTDREYLEAVEAARRRDEARIAARAAEAAYAVAASALVRRVLDAADAGDITCRDVGGTPVPWDRLTVAAQVEAKTRFWMRDASLHRTLIGAHLEVPVGKMRFSLDLRVEETTVSDDRRTEAADRALEQIRETFHRAVRDLDKPDYRRVMEEVAADMDAHLDALDEEEADRDDAGAD